MKNIYPFLVLIFSILLPSCGGQKDSTGKELSSDEEKIVEGIKNNLNKNYTLIDYQVLNSTLPYQLWMDLSLQRLWLVETSAHYETDMEWGEKYNLDNYAQKAHERVSKDAKRYGDMILEKIEESKNNPKSKRELIVVLGTIEYDNGLDNHKFKRIYAYNPETLERVLFEEIPFTATVLTTHALHNSLEDYIINGNKNLDSLANTVDNPVLKFILKPIPEN